MTLPNFMKILLVGGMSGGHVAPLVAVWRALQSRVPNAAAHFICSEREGDAAFLAGEGVAFTRLPAPRLSLLFPATFLRAFLGARRVIASFRPAVVFGKGGALSVPVCLAARMAKIPIVLHDSDAVAGRANAIVARWAAAVCRGFPQPGDPLPMFTGNPIRPEVTRGSRERGLALTEFSGHRPVLLVIGGSQGSEALNEAVRLRLDGLLETCDVAHLTGAGKEPAVARAGYWSRGFLHRELPDLYAIADLALSRAGAGAIGELAANGIPMILVPLRGVGHDHQEANARAVERRGGCVVLEQCDLPGMLVPTVVALLREESKLTGLAENAHTFHRPDAADVIAGIVVGAAAAPRP